MTRISAALATAAALAAAAGTIATAGSAAAGEGPRGPMLDFAAIDTDGDGSLSRAELQARAVDRLSVADVDRDGTLDREELLVLMPGRGDAPFRVFSADPDLARVDRLLATMGATEAGRVEVTVFADRKVNMLLAALDTDRDAAISTAEVEARERAHDRRHGPGPDGRGHGPHHGRGGPDAGPGVDGPRWGDMGRGDMDRSDMGAWRGGAHQPPAPGADGVPPVPPAPAPQDAPAQP